MKAALSQLLTDHAAHEYSNALVYLDLFTYFESVSLDGFATWAWSQYKDEIKHGQKFVRFLADTMARFRLTHIPPIESPEITDPVDALQRAYDREVDTTQRIHALRRLTQATPECRDTEHEGAFEFLSWFVTEQIEEEKTTNDLLFQLRLAGGNPSALLELNAGLR